MLAHLYIAHDAWPLDKQRKKAEVENQIDLLVNGVLLALILKHHYKHYQEKLLMYQENALCKLDYGSSVARSSAASFTDIFILNGNIIEIFIMHILIE